LFQKLIHHDKYRSFLLPIYFDSRLEKAEHFRILTQYLSQILKETETVHIDERNVHDLTMSLKFS